jgi:hypothetical protein
MSYNGILFLFVFLSILFLIFFLGYEYNERGFGGGFDPMGGFGGGMDMGGGGFMAEEKQGRGSEQKVAILIIS